MAAVWIESGDAAYLVAVYSSEQAVSVQLKVDVSLSK